MAVTGDVRRGRLAPALVGYGVTLGVMAVLATGVHPLTGVGAMIFAFSDMAIAVSAFVFPYRFGADGFVTISTWNTHIPGKWRDLLFGIGSEGVWARRDARHHDRSAVGEGPR